MEMGYLTALHARLGAKIGDLHAKDSNSFCNRLIDFNRFFKFWFRVRAVSYRAFLLVIGGGK